MSIRVLPSSIIPIIALEYTSSLLAFLAISLLIPGMVVSLRVLIAVSLVAIRATAASSAI
jgi:energy-converting hydrogenase Eha subunit G